MPSSAAVFDLDRYLVMPRVSGLHLAPDGGGLVAVVAVPAADGKRFTSGLWWLDPSGATGPRRLTRSRPGESDTAFLPDGSLIFVSARPDPDAAEDPDEEIRALWLLPRGGGEARLLAAPPGGVEDVAVARDNGRLVLAVATHPGSKDWDEDRQRHKARDEAGVTAQLFERYPIRQWDRYLGPRERRLYAHAPVDPLDGRIEAPRDLTPDPRQGLEDTAFDATPDGRTVVTGWWREVGDPRDRTQDLVAIDTGTSEHRVLAASDGAMLMGPVCSPDGRWVVCLRLEDSTPDAPGDKTLWLVDIDTGGARDLLPGFDHWPTSPVWSPDSAAVLFTADDGGHTLPFRVDLAGGAVRRLAAEGAFGDLCPSPDGQRCYALRSTVGEAPRVVVLDVAEADQQPRTLPTPGDDVETPGIVERVTSSAADGREIGSWLVLPRTAAPHDPVPLVVFIHGGPVSSWTGWHWRWNPHLLAARGYAVLLPDPALSTGYGLDFIARGWGRWGDEPYTDLMAAVDGACARDDVDPGRVAAMGGSFGGYMANWVAGHTDRFRAIVTHASLWSLRGFHGTTDLAVWWEREFGDPYTDPDRYVRHSPEQHVDRITTPMLVIHGERDFRVPIGEALKLWTDLRRHGVEARFLYFPDEHHWIQRPQNVRVWYDTVLAFLDTHVLGRAWQRPELL